MESNVCVYDLECNQLYPLQTKTWTLRIHRLGTEEWLRLNPFKDNLDVKKEFLNFIFKYPEPIIVGHNILGYDSWVLWKDFGLDFRVGPDLLCGKPVKYFDTLFASQFFYPDREGGHSLKSWGIRFGDEKIDYKQLLIDKEILPKGSPDGSEFEFWTADMDIYCEKDCHITGLVFTDLYDQMLREEAESSFRLGQKDFYLMNAQAFTGFAFDQKYAKELEIRIEGMMEEIRQDVEPGLPKRTLKSAEKAYYQMPAKPHKQDGAFSSHMEKFIERHKAEVLSESLIWVYGEEYEIEPHKMLNVNQPMSLNDQKDLKEYFLENGWKPTLWNYKKNAQGKFMRDDKKQLIKTTPKIQEGNKICENLLELQGELPSKVVKYLSLKNRLGTLKGWLKDPRLQFDGRISAGASGIANTHRQKHIKVVNVPKAQDDILLGKEFRSLWVSEKGYKIVACDQAALEARCEAHWVYKYDKEAANELLDGDPHSKNAKAFYPEETKDFDINAPDFNKDNPKFKPFRSKSKNGKYAITYGAAPKKVGTTLGIPLDKSQEKYDAFWEINKGLKELKEKLTIFWKTEGNKLWIIGIDKRRLYSRSEHSLINLLFQSTAAIIMQYALALFDMKMGGLLIDYLGRPYYLYRGYIVRRVGFWHDEFENESQIGIEDEIAQIEEWCMEEAGRRLKLNVPLKGEAKIGNNWCETH